MSVLGHDAAVAELRAAAEAGKLHHAWLLTGPQGVGKARFAEAAALWLLARSGDGTSGPGFMVSASHRAASLMAAGSHPDYKRLTRLPKDRSEELARSISVDQVRSLQPLFATTPSLSPTRVVVIDAIDELERGAANALLKNLEEPPAGTTFLLVSHAPGRLLPTIRSRCRPLRFSRLDHAISATILRRALPDAGADEIAALADVADGAPGTAIRFAGLDLQTLDASIERLATHGDHNNAQRTTLARALGAKGAQPRYEVFLERAQARIAAAVREGQGDRLATIGLWERARGIAESAVRLSLDPQLTTFELAGLVAALAPEEGRAKR